jgi:hypothetical protein
LNKMSSVATGISGSATPSAASDFCKAFTSGTVSNPPTSVRAVVGEEEYKFMSKTTGEVDADETETKLRFMLWKDDNNFISIKQEIEVEGTPGTPDYEYEEEFKYLVVENGEVVKSFKLELENEDNELELEVRIDGVKYEVEYEVIDDRTFIHVKVQGTEYTYEKVITTNEETGEVTVSYVLQ